LSAILVSFCLHTHGQKADKLADVDAPDEVSPLSQLDHGDLKTLHTDMDSNDDGKLSKMELLEFWGKARSARKKEQTETMLKAHDHEARGHVTLDQILAQHATEFDADGNPSSDDGTEKQFRLSDFDGDGHLTEEEHRAFLDPASSETMVERMAQEDLKSMDSNSDGDVELGEFAEVHPFGMDDGEVTTETKHKFAVLDHNGDGRLSWNELKSRTRTDIDNTYDMTHKLLHIADANGDGNIDAKEFVASMAEFQEHDLEAAQILSDMFMKRRVAAAPPSSFLLQTSSLVPFAAGIAILGVYSIQRRFRASSAAPAQLQGGGAV